MRSRRTVARRRHGSALTARRASATRAREPRRPRARTRRRRPSSRPPAASAPTRRAPPSGALPRPRSAARSSSTSRSTKRSSASPAGSSSTGVSLTVGRLLGSRPSAPRASAFLWPTGLGGFGGKINVGKISDIIGVHRDERARRSTCRAARAYVVAVPAEPTSRAAKKVYSPIIVRRDGAGVRRALPAVRAPRLSRAVVPELAVVRVPVPRLEVQPGRREEGRPGAARSRPLRRSSSSGGSITIDTGDIDLGPPIGTNTTGQQARRPALRLISTHRRSAEARMPRGVAFVVTVRHVSSVSIIVAVVAIVAFVIWAVLSPKRATRTRSRPRTSRRSSPTTISKAAGSNACRAGRCSSRRSSRSRCRSTGCASRPARTQSSNYFDKNAVDARRDAVLELVRCPTTTPTQSLQCANCHGAKGAGRQCADPLNGEPVLWQAPPLNTVLCASRKTRSARSPSTSSPTARSATSPRSSPTAGPARRCRRGVCAGGGPKNEQSIQDLVAFLRTIQLKPAAIQAQADDRTSRRRSSTSPKTACPQYMTCPASRTRSRSRRCRPTPRARRRAHGAAEGAEDVRRDRPASSPPSCNAISDAGRRPIRPRSTDKQARGVRHVSSTAQPTVQTDAGRVRLGERVGETPCQRERRAAPVRGELRALPHRRLVDVQLGGPARLSPAASTASASRRWRRERRRHRLQPAQQRRDPALRRRRVRRLRGAGRLRAAGLGPEQGLRRHRYRHGPHARLRQHAARPTRSRRSSATSATASTRRPSSPSQPTCPTPATEPRRRPPRRPRAKRLG